ncbi:hypothetical protein sync_1492 [Synechococcus sp. CC9311]|nr:hypothetical protein sync_1492 [Synechococcus sp. CC9311]
MGTNTKAIHKKLPQFIAMESLHRYRIGGYLMAYRYDHDQTQEVILMSA